MRAEPTAEPTRAEKIERVYAQLGAMAREHKRLMNRHRRAARALYDQMEELRPLLAQLGIKVVHGRDQRKEGQSQ